MRNLVVTEFISLDGVIENPGWTFKYWNDEIAAFKGEETSNSDALLLGRVTYDGFSQAWPNSPDEGAPYFNNVKKYVVSNTLTNPEWNNTSVISDNVVEQIKQLKQQDGTNITVHGSGKLAQFLIANGLVDQLRLLVYPVVIGKGQRLFENGPEVAFNLIETRTLNGGVVAMIYGPENA
jgi:dihydrofolate reductase